MPRQQLVHHWWLIVLRGIAAVIFGMIAWVWPDLTGLALIVCFGVYTAIDGVAALITGIVRLRQRRHAWTFLAEGLVSLGFALAALIWPVFTALTVVTVIGLWAMVTGLVEVFAAVQLRKEIQDEWILALSGFASLIFGALIAFQPASGGVAVVWSIGWYAVVFGVLLVVWGLRLKGLRDRHRREAPALGNAQGLRR
jgi:uncharacterized membrane protein HdeD (DUF308 family)